VDLWALAENFQNKELSLVIIIAYIGTPVMEDNPDSLFMEKFSFPELNYRVMRSCLYSLFFRSKKIMLKFIVQYYYVVKHRFNAAILMQ